MKEIRRICIVDTVYTLFLYYLICGFDERDIIICSRGIPKKIRKNIKHYFFKGFRYELNYHTPKLFFKSLILKIISEILQIYEIFKLRPLLYFKTRNYNIEVYGQGHYKFSFPLYEYENSCLIEEGLGNYHYLDEPTKYNPTRERIRNFFGLYIKNVREGFGTHENIKKIYLTRPTIPDIIKNKVEVKDIDKLWNSISTENKTRIMKIFNLEKLPEFGDESLTILATQPYFEDGILSLEEELNIYKSLINNNKNKRIIIKPHPRDKKKYNEIFQNMEVIDEPVPLELLKCIGLNIKKIITINSSVGLNLSDECEIELYEKETSSEHINNGTKILKEKLNKL